MDDILAARSQMAMSLAFHIIFASIGIAMPLLMVIAEFCWLRTKDGVYLTLAFQRVSGRVLRYFHRPAYSADAYADRHRFARRRFYISQLRRKT